MKGQRPAAARTARYPGVRWDASLGAWTRSPGCAAGPAPCRPCCGRRLTAVHGVLRARWLRSLQLRVITTTLVISAVVVTLLGFFLMQQITSDQLQAKELQAGNVVDNGLITAEPQPGVASPPNGATTQDLVVSIVRTAGAPAPTRRAPTRSRSGSRPATRARRSTGPGRRRASCSRRSRAAGHQGERAAEGRARTRRASRSTSMSYPSGRQQPGGRAGLRRPGRQLLPAVLLLPADSGAADAGADPANAPAGRHRAGVPVRGDRGAGHPLGGDPGPAAPRAAPSGCPPETSTSACRCAESMSWPRWRRRSTRWPPACRRR